MSKKPKTTRVLFTGSAVVEFRQYRDVTDEELREIKRVYDGNDIDKIDALIDGWINKNDIDNGTPVEEGNVYIVTKGKDGKEKLEMLYSGEGYLDEDNADHDSHRRSR